MVFHDARRTPTHLTHASRSRLTRRRQASNRDFPVLSGRCMTSSAAACIRFTVATSSGSSHCGYQPIGEPESWRGYSKDYCIYSALLYDRGAVKQHKPYLFPPLTSIFVQTRALGLAIPPLAEVHDSRTWQPSSHHIPPTA